jgi:SOS-response transcriptional repressor LexA
MVIMIDFWKRFDVQAKTLSLSKKEVASLTGINYASFINYATKDRIPKTEEAARIAKAIGTTVEYLIFGEEPDTEDIPSLIQLPSGQTVTPMQDEEPSFLVPVAPQKISAGHGEDFLPESQFIGHVRILERMARGIDKTSLIAASVKGDSMTGVQIFEGDLVIFARGHISENGIYVISLFGEVKVKRLEFRAAEQKIYIHSENSRYSTESVTMENENLIILGKVVGWVHCHPY